MNSNPGPTMYGHGVHLFSGRDFKKFLFSLLELYAQGYRRSVYKVNTPKPFS